MYCLARLHGALKRKPTNLRFVLVIGVAVLSFFVGYFERDAYS